MDNEQIRLLLRFRQALSRHRVQLDLTRFVEDHTYARMIVRGAQGMADPDLVLLALEIGNRFQVFAKTVAKSPVSSRASAPAQEASRYVGRLR